MLYTGTKWSLVYLPLLISPVPNIKLYFCTAVQRTGLGNWVATKPVYLYYVLPGKVPSPKESSENEVDMFLSETMWAYYSWNRYYCNPVYYTEKIHPADPWAPYPSGNNVVFSIYRVSAVLYIRLFWQLHHCPFSLVITDENSHLSYEFRAVTVIGKCFEDVKCYEDYVLLSHGDWYSAKWFLQIEL